jgi:hypothetical protein
VRTSFEKHVETWYHITLFHTHQHDHLAERLRRWPAKPLYIVRVSSNLTVVEFFLRLFFFFFFFFFGIGRYLYISATGFFSSIYVCCMCLYPFSPTQPGQRRKTKSSTEVQVMLMTNDGDGSTWYPEISNIKER